MYNVTRFSILTWSFIDVYMAFNSLSVAGSHGSLASCIVPWYHLTPLRRCTQSQTSLQSNQVCISHFGLSIHTAFNTLSVTASVLSFDLQPCCSCAQTSLQTSLWFLVLGCSFHIQQWKIAVGTKVLQVRHQNWPSAAVSSFGGKIGQLRVKITTVSSQSGWKLFALSAPPQEGRRS